MPEQQVKLYPCFRPRPTTVPARWLVWNAPRPVYGSEIDGDKTQVDWWGKPWHGVHYAATDPDDPDFGLRNRINVEAGGWVLTFVDPTAARGEAMRYLITSSAITHQRLAHRL